MMSDTVNGQPGVQLNAEPLRKSALRISLFLDPIPPVIESEEFCCMFRTRLGAHSIVYGAEMDGLEVNDRLNGLTGDVDGIDLNGETFVELKTSRIVEHPGQVGWTGNFPEKLLHHHQNSVFQERTLKKFKQIKWWCQSFLVGVPTIVCGFRDDDGVVEKVVQVQDYFYKF